MKNPKEYLERDRLLHADMLDALRNSEYKTLYSEDDGVLLYLEREHYYSLSAKNSECTKRLCRFIDRDDWFMILAHQPDFIPKIFEMTGEMRTLPCWQVCYRKEEPPKAPELPGVEFKDLDASWLDFVVENYSHSGGDSEYIAERIEEGMIGAFVDGCCAGFIGCHGEGSMGLLEVLPEYRRRGIGEALEARMINRKLEHGRIPYDHVVVGNEKSKALQNKLGMSFARGVVTWLFKNED